MLKWNKNKKKENKELEFKIRMIQEIDTLKIQNEYLCEHLNRLEMELGKHIQGGNN